MMWLDCPRAIAEPPTCVHPKQIGSFCFFVIGPDRSVNVGPEPDCTERTCECDLSEAEWESLMVQAVDRYNEGPDEDGMW